MIKFFRKIRYDLMEKNKTGKYFKYAIGEILLVMIGILLALQVSNWNEDNKSEKEGDVTSISNNSKNTSKNSTFREVANDDFKNIEEGNSLLFFYFYKIKYNFQYHLYKNCFTQCKYLYLR